MKLWLLRALVLISAIRTPWDRMPIASAASKQALDPKAEQSIPPLRIMEGSARDQRELLITLQLTPSQTAITETAFGRSFYFAQHGRPDDGGSLSSQKYSFFKRRNGLNLNN
jgi:hypothetical protein